MEHQCKSYCLLVFIVVCGLNLASAVQLVKKCSDLPTCSTTYYGLSGDACWSCVNGSRDCRCIVRAGSKKCTVPTTAWYSESLRPCKSCQNAILRCVPECNTEESLTDCTTQCPPRHYQINDNECVDTCPPEKRFIEKGKCVLSCRDKMVINDTVCVESCPEYAPLYYDKTCLAKCPDGLIIESNDPYSFDKNVPLYCKTKCEHSLILGDLKYLWHGQWRCAFTSCPDGTLKDGNICKNRCSTSRMVYNKECVSKCPNVARNHVVIGNNTHCVPTCPKEKPYVKDEQCLEICPKDNPLVWVDEDNNLQCLNVCPPVTKLHNNSSICVPCPSTAAYYADGQCVARCPVSHPYSDNKICLTSCPVYANPDTKLCEDRCPSAHPYSLSGKCLLECPWTHKYIDNYKCVTSCGKKMTVNTTLCTDTCPSYAPLKYDTTCVTHCPGGSEESIVSFLNSIKQCEINDDTKDDKTLFTVSTTLAVISWILVIYIARDISKPRISEGRLATMLGSWTDDLDIEDERLVNNEQADCPSIII